MICDHCKIEKQSNKLPRGWKRHNDQLWCDKCWKKSFILRAITIPVVRPLGEGIGWPELRFALKQAWSMATGATNLAMSLHYAAEKPRTPKQEKLLKNPNVYTYPKIRKAFPDLPCVAVATIGNKVSSRFGKIRYSVAWTGDMSLPSARYPQPFPVPNRAWSATFETSGKDGGDLVPCVSVPLPGRRMLLQLRGGREFARQLNDLKLIVRGDAIQGELAIIGSAADSTRNSIASRDSGGQRKTLRVLVKIVAWFPRQQAKSRHGVLFVCPGEFDSLLVAVNAKSHRLFTINADDVPRIIAEHERQRQRWSEDSKMEERRQESVSFQSRREAACERFDRKMDNAVKRIAAQVVNYADRQKFSEIHWQEKDAARLEGFRWFALKERIKVLADSKGIAFQSIKDTKNENQEVTAVTVG